MAAYPGPVHQSLFSTPDLLNSILKGKRGKIPTELCTEIEVLTQMQSFPNQREFMSLALAGAPS